MGVALTAWIWGIKRRKSRLVDVVRRRKLGKFHRVRMSVDHEKVDEKREA